MNSKNINNRIENNYRNVAIRKEPNNPVEVTNEDDESINNGLKYVKFVLPILPLNESIIDKIQRAIKAYLSRQDLPVDYMNINEKY